MFSFFSKKKFCPVCAKKLKADVNFCDSCGFRFESSESVATSVSERPAVSVPRFYYTYNGKKYDLTVGILLIKQGDFIQGIKSIRETTTLGLAEAKAIADDIKAKLDSGYVFDIERLEQTAPAKINPNRFYYTYRGKTYDLTDGLDLTRRGEIVMGVKAIREATTLGLAEAKLISDDIRAKIAKGEL